MIKAKAIALFLLLSSLMSCAPGLRQSISISHIAVPERDLVSKVPLKVRLVRIEDQRSSRAVATVNGREVTAEENVGEIVQQALESYFRSQGIQPVLFDTPAIIDGEVTEWEVAVHPAFPATNLSAKAAIRLSLRDGKDSMVYRGTYSGETSTKHPFTSEAVVSNALGEAMAAALGEAVRDQRLVSAIQSLQ